MQTHHRVLLSAALVLSLFGAGASGARAQQLDPNVNMPAVTHEASHIEISASDPEPTSPVVAPPARVSQDPEPQASPSQSPAKTKPAPPPSSDDDVEVRLEPVAWLPTVNSTVTVGDTRFDKTLSASGTITPSQIVPDLHFAFAGRVEGRDGHWGGFGEIFYVSIGAPARVAGSGGTLNTKMTLAQVSGFYRVNAGQVPIDFVAGFRIGAISNNLDFSSSTYPALGGHGFNVTRSNTDVDPIIGVRVGLPVAKKLSLQLYGDIGGFGIGNNQNTWRAQGIFGWDMCEKVRLLLGYTAVNFSSERGRNTTYFKQNTTFQGPVLGASFKL